jgi:hypothetical protein
VGDARLDQFGAHTAGSQCVPQAVGMLIRPVGDREGRLARPTAGPLPLHVLQVSRFGTQRWFGALTLKPVVMGVGMRRSVAPCNSLINCTSAFYTTSELAVTIVTQSKEFAEHGWPKSSWPDKLAIARRKSSLQHLRASSWQGLTKHALLCT